MCMVIVFDNGDFILEYFQSARLFVSNNWWSLAPDFELFSYVSIASSKFRLTEPESLTLDSKFSVLSVFLFSVMKSARSWAKLRKIPT